MQQHLINDAIQHFSTFLPKEWSAAWLRVEIHSDGSGGTIAAYAIVGPTTARSVPLPPAQLTRWQKLWHAMQEGTAPWSAATLRLAPDGRFDLHHDYEPLGDTAPLARHTQWLAANLKGYEIIE